MPTALVAFKLNSELVEESIFNLPKLLRDVRLNNDELKLVFINKVRIT